MVMTDMNTQAVNRYLNEQDKYDKAYELAERKIIDRHYCEECSSYEECLDEDCIIPDEREQMRRGCFDPDHKSVLKELETML